MDIDLCLKSALFLDFIICQLFTNARSLTGTRDSLVGKADMAPALPELPGQCLGLSSSKERELEGSWPALPGLGNRRPCRQRGTKGYSRGARRSLQSDLGKQVANLSWVRRCLLSSLQQGGPGSSQPLTLLQLREQKQLVSWSQHL